LSKRDSNAARHAGQLLIPCTALFSMEFEPYLEQRTKIRK
jgi:hypothetical protein